jgi:FtsP/CotA-like multicopper oxidase with cupredoxin domain
MSDEIDFTDQTGEEDRNASPDITGQSGFTRRDFLTRTMAVAGGLAFFSMLPRFATNGWTGMGSPPMACPNPQPLQSITQIQSSGKVLNTILKILDEQKTYTGPNCAPSSGRMRYMAAVDPNTGTTIWPPNPKVVSPGPTLRARLGDQVQITLLNQVDPSKFPENFDVAETTSQACDQNTTQGIGNTYPGNPSFEVPPNCYHASGSMNLHFHGTHVSPSGVADNVLLNIHPSPRDAYGKPIVNETTVKADFATVFSGCSSGKQILEWNDWPQNWQDTQKQMLVNYDNTTPWNGQKPPPGGPPALPHDEQLWPQNLMAMEAYELPQYYMGGFPNCFKITEYNPATPTNPVMGQAPGTHWYHSHKHGSTALNLANGLAGAFIIEGDYDDKLRPYFTKEQVLVFQTFATVMPEMRAANVSQPSDLVMVNGQWTPLLQMNPNEMQMWRMVNACYNQSLSLNAPTGIKWVQTAQDGVQFAQANYNPAVTNASFPVPARSVAPFGSFAPGNRIDLLVQAPSATGQYPVKFAGVTVLIVDVRQDPNVKPIATPMPFPTQAQFPVQPAFLADLSFADVKVKRDLHFASNPSPVPTPSPFYKVPMRHTIDGKQFNGNVDQTMLLGGTEEWTLYNDNSTGLPHPFHIHINPFQVVEMKTATGNPVKLPRPWIWWDNFAIPPGGYVKILTKFVDFTGKFVLHCHFLDHEDRGMMQLVQVVTNTTTMKHN